MDTAAPIREERIKAEKDGLAVLADIRRYAADPALPIAEDDLWRFKWYGIYGQKPAGSGHYMIRIKMPGGRVSADQAERLAGLGRLYGRNVVDITTRQAIQLHWLRTQDLPAVLDAISLDIGLFQEFGCGDVPRTVTGCPLAGVIAEEHVDASGLVTALNQLWHDERESFSNLPRKFKASAGGCRIHCHLPQINDIGFFGHTRADGVRGLGVAVGGGLRNTPYMAQSLRVFIPLSPDLAVQIARQLALLYRGCDDLRQKRLHARFKFHVAEVGWEAIRDALEAGLGFRLDHDDSVDGPEGAAHNQDHTGRGRQQDGRDWVGVPIPCGRVSGDQLAWFASLARCYAVSSPGRMVFTPKQNLVLLDIARERSADLGRELADAGFPIDAPLAATFTTCTGSEYCNLAVTETKAMGRRLLDRLSGAIRLDEPFFIAITGCPNSCAHYWLGDIGLTGAKLRWRGRMEDAYHVLVGGALGRDPRFACEIVAGEGPKGRIRIPEELLDAAIMRLVDAYRGERLAGDRFGAWARRQAMPRLAQLLVPPELAAGLAPG